jgi:hypothetical protein
MEITTARTTWGRIDFIIALLLVDFKARMLRAFPAVGFFYKPKPSVKYKQMGFGRIRSLNRISRKR